MKRFLLIMLAASMFLTSWVQASQQPTQPSDPIPNSSSAKPDQSKAAIKVWVNTKSGVYHCPGTRWYGKTKDGEYMSQADAQKKGYRPAYHKVCE